MLGAGSGGFLGWTKLVDLRQTHLSGHSDHQFHRLGKVELIRGMQGATDRRKYTDTAAFSPVCF